MNITMIHEMTNLNRFGFFMAWFGRVGWWFDQWVFYYYFICFPVLDLFLFSPSFSSIFYISIMKNKQYA